MWKNPNSIARKEYKLGYTLVTEEESLSVLKALLPEQQQRDGNAA